MLKLKPTCEHCDKQLPPDSVDARICSYECTFCVDCVDNVLQNVCPNCGGGFERRPIRPVTDWVSGVSLKAQPATMDKTFKPVEPVRHAELVQRLAAIPPQKR